MREHQYSIGQAVRMANRPGAIRTDGFDFTITGKMPAEGRKPQYRIRSDEERYERVVTEDMIEAMLRRDAVDSVEKIFAPRPLHLLPL